MKNRGFSPSLGGYGVGFKWSSGIDALHDLFDIKSSLDIISYPYVGSVHLFILLDTFINRYYLYMEVIKSTLIMTSKSLINRKFQIGLISLDPIYNGSVNEKSC